MALPGPKVERPTPAQVDAMRKAAHAGVDRIVDSWPAMIRRIGDYSQGPGSASGGIAGGGGRGMADPTGRRATAGEERDPAAELRAWLRTSLGLLDRLVGLAEQARALKD